MVAFLVRYKKKKKNKLTEAKAKLTKKEYDIKCFRFLSYFSLREKKRIQYLNKKEKGQVNLVL